MPTSEVDGRSTGRRPSPGEDPGPLRRLVHSRLHDLGVRQSTIDLWKTILNGGILLVSTTQGPAGPNVTALVGASLLKPVDAVIRKRERLPLGQRRDILVAVDEMETIPAL